MRKGFVASFKVRKANPLTPLLKGLSYISKFFFGRMDFSLQSSPVILGAREEAFRRGNASIRLEHIFFSLLKLRKGKVIEVLENLNCNITTLQQQTEKEINKFPKKDKNFNIPFSPHANNVIKSASSIGNEFKCKEIETEHLLLAILKEESSLLAPILQTYNITYDRCYYQLRKLQ